MKTVSLISFWYLDVRLLIFPVVSSITSKNLFDLHIIVLNVGSITIRIFRKCGKFLQHKIMVSCDMRNVIVESTDVRAQKVKNILTWSNVRQYNRRCFWRNYDLLLKLEDCQNHWIRLVAAKHPKADWRLLK